MTINLFDKYGVKLNFKSLIHLKILLVNSFCEISIVHIKIVASILAENQNAV